MMLVCRLDRFDDTKSSDDESNSNSVPDPKNISDSTFQVAASWQANKNCLLKVPYLIQSYACDIGAYQDHETCAHFLFIPAGKGGPSQLIASIRIQIMVETFFHVQHFRYVYMLDFVRFIRPIIT